MCQLAVEISEAQRREIFEMDWLIKDIQDNGRATTAEEAGPGQCLTTISPQTAHAPRGESAQETRWSNRLGGSS